MRRGEEGEDEGGDGEGKLWEGEKIRGVRREEEAQENDEKKGQNLEQGHKIRGRTGNWDRRERKKIRWLKRKGERRRKGETEASNEFCQLRSHILFLLIYI